eukprot:3941140-Rhodomonas_salina.1
MSAPCRPYPDHVSTVPFRPDPGCRVELGSVKPSRLGSRVYQESGGAEAREVPGQRGSNPRVSGLGVYQESAGAEAREVPDVGEEEGHWHRQACASIRALSTGHGVGTA